MPNTPIVLVLLALAVPGHVVAQGRASTGSRTAGTASIAGRIINADGSAAANARVVIYAVREGAPAAILGTTTSAFDGRYELGRLAAGEVTVGVTPSTRGGFGGDARKPAQLPVETFYPGVTARDRASAVTLFEGVSAEGIDVWLAPAPQRFTVSGRIVWPEGTSVESLTIEYGGPDAIRRGIWNVDDPGGLFTIAGVAQETYVLLARGETSAGPLLGIASTAVAIGPVEDVRLTLRAPGTIEGRIITEGGSPPLMDLEVIPVHTLLTLSPVYPIEPGVVDAEGRFRLSHLIGEYTLAVSGLPSGWRIARLMRQGVALTNERIRVGAGERVEVDVVVTSAPPKDLSTR
jgi:hypothetical protein